MKTSISVILHNIRSAHNVGSVFRTADGAGVTHIYLAGYTPQPVDRFGREHKEIKKTALSATESVPHEYHANIHELVLSLKQEGKDVVAVEQTKDALDYKKFNTTKDTVFVFGNETTGIEEGVLSLCDTHINIPMHGQKESLNVSVCAGVILFHFV